MKSAVTEVRSQLESILIDNKELIATILQKHGSNRRVDKYLALLNGIIESLKKGEEITEQKLIDMADLHGKLVVGSVNYEGKKFAGETKSAAFISVSLDSALKCPICHGYLDPEKSISYDHIQPIRESGTASLENCQLTHPFCNQSVKQ